VQALSDEAKRFYRHFGFQASPVDPMTLLLSIKTILSYYDAWSWPLIFATRHFHMFA
tara:strand:+ start:7425 stop:7595 length:171 start_codon:yes stop_codon:yes gene_type:complete